MNSPTTTGGRPINALTTIIKNFFPKKSLMLMSVANGMDIMHDKNTARRETFREVKIISYKLILNEVMR